jgi:putative thioredoxin
MAVFDIVGEEDFRDRVLARSRQRPVLVDFWAECCGPCRMLGPVLEKVASERSNELDLAKVDTERNPELSAQFRVSSIPAVKLFRDGAVVDEFVGALPERAVRAFVDAHVPSESARQVAEARAQLSAGDRDAARASLERALAADPASAPAHLELAKMSLADSNEADTRAHVDAIPVGADEWESANHVREAIGFLAGCAAAGGEAQARTAVVRGPEDPAPRYALACCLAARGQYREALDELLIIVAKDRRWRDEAGRKAMLTIFGLAGIRSELSDSYRKKLALYL